MDLPLSPGRHVGAHFCSLHGRVASQCRETSWCVNCFPPVQWEQKTYCLQPLCENNPGAPAGAKTLADDFPRGNRIFNGKNEEIGVTHVNMGSFPAQV